MGQEGRTQKNVCHILHLNNWQLDLNIKNLPKTQATSSLNLFQNSN